MTERSRRTGDDGGGSPPTGVVAARARAALLSLIVGGLAGGGCSAPKNTVDGEPFALEPLASEHARALATVKTALVETLGIDAAAVGVTLEDEAIRLGGFVDDEGARERALSAARGAAGERAVIDALEIR